MPRLLTDRFGLSFTRAECYCGSTLNASGSVGTSAADSVCQAAACPGDTSQACGGPYRMRLFKFTPSTFVALPSGWQSQGCEIQHSISAIMHEGAPAPFDHPLTPVLALTALCSCRCHRQLHGPRPDWIEPATGL
jgi:hypothetical protein